MIAESAEQIWTPAFQYGFAGFCLILLAKLAWMVRNYIILSRELMQLLDKTNAIIEKNTFAITTVDQRVVEEQRMLHDIRDRLLSRPCIADEGVRHGS